MCIRDRDSPHHINPMDIDLSFDEENPMALKADFILSLMELIVGGKDGLQPVERTVIDRCVRQMYRKHLHPIICVNGASPPS